MADINIFNSIGFSPISTVSGTPFIGGAPALTAFPNWPSNSFFTNSVFGLYGLMPYLDFLIDPNSQYGIGGIAFKTTIPGVPYISTDREGANTFAVMEANTFNHGGDTPYTSTIEFYLGTTGGTGIYTILSLGNIGTHFYGSRINPTIDAQYCLFVGNERGADGTGNYNFESVNSTFAVDAIELPFTFFNYPNKISVDPTDQVLILDSNGEMWQVTLTALKTALDAL